MRVRGPLSVPRHQRDVATEPCDYCWADIGKPCRQRIWSYKARAYRPVIGSKVKHPHMTRGVR